MRKTAFRLIQISDMHWFANPAETLLGINTRHSFDAVYETLMQNHPNVDAIILTGDISQDGSISSYQSIVNVFKKQSCPIYWLPGNHDNLAHIHEGLTGLNEPHPEGIVYGNWQLLFLNSVVNPKVEGYLSDATYQHLEKTLQRSTRDTLIFLHHHIQPIQCVWLDALGLQDREKFVRFIKRYPHVRAIVSGHVHQASGQTYQQVTYLTSPSTCFQFLPNSKDFSIDSAAPGYRWFELKTDGTFITGVHRVKEYKYTLNLNARAY